MKTISAKPDVFIFKNVISSLSKPAVVYTVFAAVFIANLIVYLVAEDFYLAYFYGEDRVIEWITFVGFLCGSLLGLAILYFHRAEMNALTLLYLVGLSFFLFVCAGEEISWGQRIFGFATPESLVELNQQQELNLHNLKVAFIHPRDVIGGFNYLWGIILPIVFFYKVKTDAWRRYIPSPVTAVCFCWAELLNIIDRPILALWGARMEEATAHLIINQSDEMVEMFWSLSVLVGMMSIYTAWSLFNSHKQ